MPTTWTKIELQTRRRADQACIRYGNSVMTYDDLDRLSHLIALGIQNCRLFHDYRLVKVYLDRSEWFAVVAVAIWRAGGTYLPLDPGQPRERFDQILGLTGPGILVTDRENRLENYTGIQLIIEELIQLDAAPLRELKDPAELAYVLFTSGSTGIPKGVEISHAALLNHLGSIRSYWPYKDPPVGAALTPFVFDVSVWEIFSVLTEGGTLHLLPGSLSYDAGALVNYLSEQKVDQVYLPPGLVPEIASRCEAEGLQFSLKRILVGVEPIRESHLITILNSCSDAVLLNGYGPTEATVCCTVYPVSGVGSGEVHTPIGWPMPGYEVILVDEQCKGEKSCDQGEIWIGGESLAKGYLGDPELTGKKFVTGKDGLRYFRTGDMARRLENGALLFLGRDDSQLKIRGYRIDTAEIERSISLFTGVEETAVFPVTHENGFRYLVAYAGGSRMEPEAEEELHRFLMNRLPDYMVPAAIRIRHTLPRNASGKIDRDLLLQWMKEMPEPGTPENEMESVILECWREVLGSESIGTRDSFYFYGANSLAAARIAARIEERTGRRCRIGTLMKHPTVRMLARAMQEQVGADTLLNNDPGGDPDLIPLLPTHEQLIFLHEADLSGRTHNILMRLDFSGEIQPDALLGILNRFMESQPSLHLRIIRTGGRLYQQMIQGYRANFSMHDLSVLSEDERQKTLNEATSRLGEYRFELSRGPLHAGALYRLDRQRYQFIWNVHHLVFDGWSMSILLRAIRNWVQGQPIDRVADYRGWIRENLEKYREISQSEIERRIAQLEPFAIPLTFSGQQRRGEHEINRGERHWFSFPEALVQGLDRLAVEQGSTLFALLHSLYGYLISLYSGKDRFIIGTPYANRHTPLADQVTGNGITILLTGFRADYDQAFDVSLRDNHQRIQDAFEVTYLTAGELLTPLNQRTNGYEDTLFQALFIFQNWDHIEEPEPESEGVKVRQTDIGNQTAKMLITLNAERVNGELECWFEYETAVLKPELVSGLANDLIHLSILAVDHPKRSMSWIRGQLPFDPGAMQRPISAAFVGETSLCLGCLRHWLEGGGSAAAVMSSNPATLQYARDHSIRVIPWGRQHLSEIKTLGIDYLFSIVNSFVLKPDILAVPQFGAINYHDSLLPHFAGVNATSWALLSEVAKHGVTWHYMDAETDMGDIIIQRSFNVDPATTVFDLDLVCYEEALSGFSDLCGRIKKGRPNARRQEVVGSRFGLHQKPEFGGLVLFDLPGKDILNHFRSLDFSSNYPNKFCSPFVALTDDVIHPGKMTFERGGENLPPGTVIRWGENQISVACADGTVVISHPLDRFRRELEVSDIIRKLPVINGRPHFPKPEPPGLGKWLEHLSRNEQRWVDYWEEHAVEPGERTSGSYGTEDMEEVLLDGLDQVGIAVSAVAFLKMIHRGWRFGIRISDHDFPATHRLVTERILPLNPGEFDLEDLSLLYEDLHEQITNAVPERSFAADLFYRYPQLRKPGYSPPKYDWILKLVASGEEKLAPGEIEISAGKVRISIPASADSLLKVPEWKQRFKKLSRYFMKERFGDQVPLDLLMLESEKSVLEPDMVWNHHDLGEWLNMVVRLNPAKRALKHGQQEFSYHEMMERIRLLAAGIRHYAGNNHRIAVCMERSPDAVITQLAIYLLGYCYVPLDPANPDSRIRQLLEKGKPAMLITDAKDKSTLSEITDIQVIPVEKLAEQGEIRDWPTVNPESIAYLLFTSGSTGEPKGVPVAFGALSRFIQDSIYRFNLTHRDIGLQFASLAFDASMEEILPVLLTGGCLVIRTDEWVWSVSEFLGKVKESGITFLDLPTTFWQILVADMHANARRLPESVRLVVIGGDMAHAESYLKWKEMYPQSPLLVNTYGPTEATVTSLAWSKTTAAEKRDQLPVGLPVNSQRARLVLENGLDAPPGVPGELWLSGPTLSPGYLGDEALTARRWIDLKGTIWYRTGDWVEREPEGVIHFIGRIDDQVKIDGYLVDLNEVLASLRQLDGVRDAAVRTLIHEDKRILVAYCSFFSDPPPEAVMRASLAQQVPSFMVPTRILALDSLPYNQNNKVDWSRLPVPGSPDEPEPQLPEPGAPADALEESLHEIWRRHLKRERIDPEANLFELGLNSLTAISVLSELEQELGKPVPLAILLQYPSIRELARGLKAHEEQEFFRPLVKIKPGGSKRPLFIIHGAGLNVLLFNTLKDLMDPEQPIYGIQARGMDGAQPILTSLEEIVDAYTREIKSVQPTGPYALAGFSLGGLIAFELARQLKARGDLVDFIGVFDTYAESSQKSWSFTRRVVHRLVWNWHKFWFNLVLILREPADLIPKKIKWFKFRIRRMLAGHKVIRGEDLQRLPDKLFHIANATIRAVSELELKPIDAEINVFRAAHRNFYIPDPDFLGWKPYAGKGVKVWNVPGDHSHIFAEPNDRDFARILQQALDESHEIHNL